MNTPTPSDLGTLLFGTYRRQVLGLLLLHPDEAFHLREIARVTQTQPGTLRRELTQLARAGVLTSEKVGNLVRYQADTSCPIYEELRGILKKTAGVVDVLRDALSPLRDRIAVAFIYGSVARGGERRTSDIDVMVVGDVNFEEVVGVLHRCQERLRREINPNVYAVAEFKRKSKDRDAFLARVMKEPKLFVQGADDDIGKLTANRKAKAS